jgi:hypothetical protein
MHRQFLNKHFIGIIPVIQPALEVFAFDCYVDQYLLVLEVSVLLQLPDGHLNMLSVELRNHRPF